MEALEADFRCRALLASVQGRRPPVSPEALVQALSRGCGVERRHVWVEVTHPADFLLSFASTEDCDRVFRESSRIRCASAPIAFQRRHSSAQVTSGKMEFFCKLGIEGLPASAWEWCSVSQLVNNLHGQLVEILPPDDRWQLDVTAWMKNPSGIPRIYDLEVPEPAGLQNTVDEEWPVAPPPPAPPTERRTLIHHLTIHVLDVVDRTKRLVLICGASLDPARSNNHRRVCLGRYNEDLTRRHDYSRSCFRGRIDGEGRGNTSRSGGHPFGGPGGLGIAGDWGTRCVNGLLASAGGMELPRQRLDPLPAPLASSQLGGVSAAINPPPPMLLTRAPSLASVATMAKGSAAYVVTPSGSSSAARTAEGSAVGEHSINSKFSYVSPRSIYGVI
ncbi:hypothetical protein VPH35_042674 [Triticum aestivum]